MGALLVLGLAGGCLEAFDDGGTPPASPLSSSVLPDTTLPVTPSVAATPPVVPRTARMISTPPTSAFALPVSTSPSETTGSEVDCEMAEEYADSGEFEAGDIADYCDYGPDPGELPDEFDWDE